MINRNPPAAPDPTLPDTPDHGIAWQPMTAFLEYYEDLTFNASGYRWFVVTGAEFAEVDGKRRLTGKYWWRAGPYRWSDGRYGEKDESHGQRATGFATMREAQENAVAILRAFRSIDTRAPRTLEETDPEFYAPEATITFSGEGKITWENVPHVAARGSAGSGATVSCEHCAAAPQHIEQPVGYETLKLALKTWAKAHASCGGN